MGIALTVLKASRNWFLLAKFCTSLNTFFTLDERHNFRVKDVLVLLALGVS